MSVDAEFHAGFIVIVGRPNVGKSTLLNTLVGCKVSITSARPQTTRNRILGIKTTEKSQFIFVDTPGLHNARGKTINRVITQTARDSVDGVDVILFLVSAPQWTAEDQQVLEFLKQFKMPILLVINKMDLYKNQNDVLGFIDEIQHKHEFAAIIPVSAVQANNTDHLLKVLTTYLPSGPLLFPQDQYTDKSKRFLAAELVREQIFRFIGQEIPYAMGVETEVFETQKNGCLNISCVIWVEKSGQKKILIGAKGGMLKQIGSQARVQLEQLLASKIYLKLWVKVREGWSDNQSALRSLGYLETE